MARTAGDGARSIRTKPAAAHSVPARVRMPKAQRYESILKVAEEVFCEFGYEAATVAEVARRAGVVEGNIYRYTKSKRELLARVISTWYARAIGELEAELALIGSVRSRLRFLIASHLRALRDSPGLMRLIIRELRTGHEEFRQIVGRFNQQYTAFLRQAIEAGVASGELRPDTPVRLVRDMIFGGIEHHAQRYLMGEGTLDVETTADLLLAVVLGGIAAGPAQRASADVALARPPEEGPKSSGKP